MKIKQAILDYLNEQPLFRERKNKDRGMVNLLMKKYGGLKKAIDEGLISKEAVIAIVQDYASMDRAWRQALEQNENLRGKDYDEKDHLEEKKLEELGYRAPRDVGSAEAVNQQGTLV
jgi:hypothetical protein